MRVSRNFKEKNQFKDLFDSGLDKGGLKEFWDPKVKPYLSAVIKKNCIFDPILSLILLKETSNLLLFFMGKDRKIALGGVPTGFESSYKMLSESKYFIFVDEKMTKLDDKKIGILVGLGHFNKELEEIKDLNFPLLTGINNGSCLEKIDYPLSGNFSSFKGNSFLLCLLSIQQRKALYNKSSKRSQKRIWLTQ